MFRFSSKYGILGCSLHFVILPTSGFTGISNLTKMYSGVWRCVVVSLITGQTQRRLCCRLRFQRVTLLCQAPGSRQRKSHRVGTPDLSQRLSSKSMVIPVTPIFRAVLHPSRYQVLLKNGGTGHRQTLECLHATPSPAASCTGAFAERAGIHSL